MQVKNETFKSHPLMIISELGRASYLILFSIFGNLSTLYDLYKASRDGTLFIVLSEMQEESLWALGGLFVILGLYLFFAWRKWYFTSYRLSEEGLSVISNRLHKTELNLRRKDISNINLSQNLLQRLCGLYQIAINTNTSATANTTDVKLFLKEDKARWLEKTLKESPQGSEVKEKAREITQFEKCYHYGEILRHALLVTSWHQLSLFILAFLFIFGLHGINTYFKLPLPPLWLELETFTKGYLTLGLLISMLCVSLGNSARVFIKYANFKIKKTEEKLYLSYGLLTKKSYTLPLEKIQAFVLKEHAFARLFGYTSLEAINIGFDDEKNETPMLLPYVRKKDLVPLLEHLMSENALSLSLTLQEKKTYWLYFLKALPSLSIITYLAYYFLERPYFYLVLFYWLFKGFHSYLDYRTKGFELKETLYCFINGSYEKATYYLKPNFLEQVELKKGLSQKGLGVISPKLYIMGSKRYINAISNFGYYEKEKLASLIKTLKK